MRMQILFGALLVISVLSGCGAVGDSPARKDIRICENIFSDHENREELKITRAVYLDTAEMNGVIESTGFSLVTVHPSFVNHTNAGWDDYKDDIRWVDVTAQYKNIAGGDTEVTDICGVIQSGCFCVSEGSHQINLLRLDAN